MKVLVFDIWSDFGHFKKYYTTSSPLTFSFPPPTAVAGMLGAIVGAGKDEYMEVFGLRWCKIAVRIVSPVKKVRMGLNHINTKNNCWIPTKKKSHDPRTQIRTEFLSNPHYRLYVAHQNEDVFGRLVKSVKGHESFYTLSMGLSELIADFKYEAVLEAREVGGEKRNISSVVPVSQIENGDIEFTEGKRFFKEKVPVEMRKERVVERYEDVIFEDTGKSIFVRLKKAWELENGECIAFF